MLAEVPEVLYYLAPLVCNTQTVLYPGVAYNISSYICTHDTSPPFNLEDKCQRKFPFQRNLLYLTFNFELVILSKLNFLQSDSQASVNLLSVLNGSYTHLQQHDMQIQKVSTISSNVSVNPENTE